MVESGVSGNRKKTNFELIIINTFNFHRCFLNVFNSIEILLVVLKKTILKMFKACLFSLSGGGVACGVGGGLRRCLQTHQTIIDVIECEKVSMILLCLVIGFSDEVLDKIFGHLFSGASDKPSDI